MNQYFNSGKLSGRCAFSWPLFLLGLFSETQIKVVGSIGITELAMFVLGPFLLIKDWSLLSKKKFTPFLWLLVLMFVSGLISILHNRIAFDGAIRGLATPYSFLTGVVVFHHFLERDIRKTRWFFIGLALSTIISVFVFQRVSNRFVDGYEVSAMEAMERKMSYSLFWLQQFISALSMPINAFYLELPKVYPVAATIFLLIYGFVQSNNRSSLIMFGGSLFLILVGGKRSRAMQFVQHNFVLITVAALIMAPIGNFAYKRLACSGFLGENAQKKYEDQVGAKSNFLQTLMGGRSDFFIGFQACLDKPLTGHGPWALDTTGYRRRFYAEHGATDQELEQVDWYSRLGALSIPSHSWLMQSWLWYGLGGLIWALYLGKLIFSTLKNSMGAIPHLYGYFALVLPANLWNWLFSPMGGRTQMAFFFTVCLFACYYQRQQNRSRMFVRGW